MADEDKADRPDTGWHVRLNRVERLDREEGDEGDVFHDAEFEMSDLIGSPARRPIGPVTRFPA